MLIDDAMIKLTESKIEWDNFDQVYDCGRSISLPIPRVSCKQSNPLTLNSAPQHGHLVFLHHSMISMPSINQIVHVACVITAASEWTWDANLRYIINVAFESLGFPKPGKIDSTRMRSICEVMDLYYD